MREHVDHKAGGIPNEEPSHPPWLICKGVDDVVASVDGVLVDGIDIRDLDAHLRLDWRRGVTSHEDDLGGRVHRRHQCHDPVHVHGYLESKEADVELSALFQPLRRDVGNDPSDTHRHHNARGAIGQRNGLVVTGDGDIEEGLRSRRPLRAVGRLAVRAGAGLLT